LNKIKDGAELEQNPTGERNIAAFDFVVVIHPFCSKNLSVASTNNQNSTFYVATCQHVMSQFRKFQTKALNDFES